MPFHNVNFPDFFARKAKSEVSFSTKIASSHSGVEIRKAEREQAIRKYVIKNIKCSYQQYYELISFFKARKGAAYAFKFKDYFDYKVINQIINTDEIIQINKKYHDNNIEYLRDNIAIKADTVKILHNNQNLNFTIKDNLLYISPKFQEIKQIYICFEFDTITRFEQDSIVTYKSEDGCITIEEINLIEVIA